jgi:hypothetical protein
MEVGYPLIGNPEVLDRVLECIDSLSSDEAFKLSRGSPLTGALTQACGAKLGYTFEQLAQGATEPLLVVGRRSASSPDWRPARAARCAIRQSSRQTMRGRLREGPTVLGSIARFHPPEWCGCN